MVEGHANWDEKKLTLNNDETNTLSSYTLIANLHTIDGISVSSWGIRAWLEF